MITKVNGVSRHKNMDGFCLSQTPACVVHLEEQVGVVRVRFVAQHELEEAHGVGRVVRLLVSFRSYVRALHTCIDIPQTPSHLPTWHGSESKRCVMKPRPAAKKGSM